MSLQLLLYWLRHRRDLLISPDEIWWSELGPDRRIERALHKHKPALAVLFAWSDRWVCPTPAHQQYYYYRGGRWFCGKCEELQPWIKEVC